jgi:hypothetical protein
MPDQQGLPNGTNNYTMGENAQDTYNNELVRLDYNASMKERFYFRTNFTKLERQKTCARTEATATLLSL